MLWTMHTLLSSRVRRRGAPARNAASSLRARALAIASLALAGIALPGLHADLAAAAPASRTPGNNVPEPVARGLADPRGAHAANAPLKLNINLEVRDRAQLRSLIAAASTPGGPDYGRYLTQAQYTERFAPTSDELGAAERWLSGRGLRVTGASRDNAIVHVAAPTATVGRALGVEINDYAYHGRAFYANDREPTLPSDLRVDWVGGMSDYEVGVPANPIHCVNRRSEPVFCGYFGSDYRAAYNLSDTGEGQTVGFTLWGKEVPQSDYTNYAKDTGTTALTVGGAGSNGLQFIKVGGASTENALGEVALDTEVAHAVAPGIHETYWLGHDSSSATLETVLSEAASSNVAVISNSWGFTGGCGVNAGMEKSLEHGAATGKTFYFSTGDAGASGGCHFPSVSQFVVAVGGTDLSVGSNSEWKSEKAMKDDGGCSNVEPRPSWQTGIGSPLEWPSTACTGRATPDVSADSCYSSEEPFGTECGAFVDVEGKCCQNYGGTSLSAPIWAAGSAAWNKANAAAGRPTLGFAAPTIYSIANDSTTYGKDFHDIQTGSNGFAATASWDEVTGWGSPNFNSLANNPADVSYTGATSATEGKSATLAATLTDHGTTHGLSGRTIKFTVGAESCEATTNATGGASCSVLIGDVAGTYTVGAKFNGDVAYASASTTHAFTVDEQAPTVTKVQPEEGPAAGGTDVTITGTKFAGATEVKFGATAAKSFKVESGTVISAESPSGTGTVDIRVANAGGTSATSAADRFTYVAGSTLPTVLTEPASPVGSDEATLNATVNPNGSNVTACEFEYGTSTSYESSAPCSALPGSGSSAIAVSAVVNSLASNTEYHFRVSATNGGGTSKGSDVSFKTLSAGPPEFGRCLKVGLGFGLYAKAACTELGGEQKFEWYAAFGASPLVKTHFTTAIKQLTVAKLETKAKQLVTCTGETSGGEYSGVTTVSGVVLKLTGCRRAEAEQCQSTGAQEGEVVMNALNGELGTITKSAEGAIKDKIGLALKPASGEVVAEFSCAGTAITVRGSVIVPVKANSMLAKQTLKLAQKAGVQQPTHFDGQPNQVLETKIGTGAYEQTGLALTTIQINEEKTEANTVA
jgi:kumamolisin